MSKAFTKEDDSIDDDFADEPSPLPVGTKNYITPKGMQKLQAELKQLLEVERPKIVNVVSWAASNGDRSENADYIYGKRRLREIDRRMRFLTKRIDAAEVIDPAQQKSETVVFGATVTVRTEAGTEKRYRIVGIDETDIKLGHISWISPVGKALLRSKVGDFVLIRMPKGEEELEILKIEFVDF